MIVEADRHALKPKPLRIIIRNGCGTSRPAIGPVGLKDCGGDAHDRRS